MRTDTSSANYDTFLLKPKPTECVMNSNKHMRNQICEEEEWRASLPQKNGHETHASKRFRTKSENAISNWRKAGKRHDYQMDENGNRVLACQKGQSLQAQTNPVFRWNDYESYRQNLDAL